MQHNEILYFSAPWCVPCRTFGPIMEEFATNHPEYTLTKIDLEQQPEKSAPWEVFSIPVIIVLQGGEQIGRFTGARTAQGVEKFFNSLA